MSKEQPKSPRKRPVTKEEMRDLNARMRALVDEMSTAIESLDGDSIDIDGFDGAWRGAELLRTQYVKVIGEVKLQSIKFEVKSPINPQDYAAITPAPVRAKASDSGRTKGKNRARKTE